MIITRLNRFSLGIDTTKADIDWTAMVLKQILDRSIVPLLVTSGR